MNHFIFLMHSHSYFIMHKYYLIFWLYNIPTTNVTVNRQAPKDQSYNKKKKRKIQEPKDVMSLGVVDHSGGGNSNIFSRRFCDHLGTTALQTISLTCALATKKERELICLWYHCQETPLFSSAQVGACAWSGVYHRLLFSRYSSGKCCW